MLLAFLIGMWSAPLVVMTVLVAHAVWSDRRTRRRLAREDAARDRAVAVRVSEDQQVEEFEAMFEIDMGFDPEALGS